MEKCKRVAAIHDISGFGRCSLTVIMPILSAMSVQACPVPTAVFSAHTGFGKTEMRDLTDYIIPALDDYTRLGVNFDCIYSGFLASSEQIDHCLEFFDRYKNALKVVDPVMGDGGSPYHTYTKQMCDRMIELVRVADIITPNLTEAAILLSEPYPAAPIGKEVAKNWLRRLAEHGPDRVVITSVPFEDETLCNVCYEKSTDTFCKIDVHFVPKQYSGSGDIFASVIVGSLLNDEPLSVAVSRATSFSEYAIKTTYQNSMFDMDGILVEPCLKWFFEEQELRNTVSL